MPTKTIVPKSVMMKPDKNLKPSKLTELKPSELFEGADSTLAKTFRAATSQNEVPSWEKEAVSFKGKIAVASTIHGTTHEFDGSYETFLEFVKRVRSQAIREFVQRVEEQLVKDIKNLDITTIGEYRTKLFKDLQQLVEEETK